jgi:hypothetical protein
MSNTFAAFQDINAAIKVSPTAELLTNRGVINQAPIKKHEFPLESAVVFLFVLHCEFKSIKQTTTI